MIKYAFKADGYDIQVSRDRPKVLFIQQFEEVKIKTKNKISKMRFCEERISINIDELTSSGNRRYLSFKLHFKDGFQPLGMIKRKGSMVT